MFENDKFYFAIVQLPRYENPSNNGNENYFLVREQQKNAALSTEYSAYSCNIDLGMLPYEAEGKLSNTSGIHPFDKKPVGERLAHAVMQDLYGAKGVYRGPELDTLYVDNGEVYVTLKNCGTGLEILYFGAGFEVAGADGIYYDAVPSLLDEERRTIKLTCSEVANPKFVRYGNTKCEKDIDLTVGTNLWKISLRICTYRHSLLRLGTLLLWTEIKFWTYKR